MEADELYRKIREYPSEAFRIYVSDGMTYDIKHPEQIMIGRRSSYVGISRNDEGPFQKIAVVSNIHITRIEPISGNKRKRNTRRKK